MEDTANKVKVLQIMPKFGYGGAEMLVKEMLLAQDHQRFEIAACSFFPFTGTPMEENLKEKGQQVYYLNKRLGPDPAILMGLIDIFRKFKPQVIHTHRYAIRYTLIPSMLCKVPINIHTVHSIAEKEVDLIGRLIHFWAFKFTKVIPVAISKTIKHSVESYYNIINVPCIYNGIQTKNFIIDADKITKIRQTLNIADNYHIMVHIGRFSSEKNHRLLVEAFSQVVERVDNAILLLLGDGELRPEIEKLVSEKGLNRKIRFLGYRNDIAALLSASDSFVLSSDWEGLPLVVIEAMAAGKPVVATAVGGISELVADNVNGILVQAGNARGLADAMVRMVRSPSTGLHMGESGRKIALEKFDIEPMLRAYEELYITQLKKYGY